jgi:GNAT superfamily N-acetyltransferase
MIFCERILADIPRPRPAGRFIFTQFSISDMDDLRNALLDVEFEIGFTTDDIPGRLEKGFILYIIKDGERIIGFCWWAVRSYLIPHFGGVIDLRPDELFCFNNYVHRNFRGHGLFNELRLHAYHDLKERGFTRDILCYFDWNKAALRMNEKMGFSPIGEVVFAYIMNNRIVHCSVSPHILHVSPDPLA